VLPWLPSDLEYPGRLSLLWHQLHLLLPPYLSRRSRLLGASTVQNEALVGSATVLAGPFAAIASYVEPLNVTTSYWL